MAPLDPVRFFNVQAGGKTQVANSASTEPYLAVDSVKKLLEFFAAKGLKKLKQEDESEKWYDDWLKYNAEHGIYASLLSPQAYSSRGTHFDLLRLIRFVEAFGSCNPSHGYSFQVSFLGIFPVLMSKNEELKKRAIKGLENGDMFAFGVSEKGHGSDLYSNEFAVTETAPGKYQGKGKKYYIGNANCAAAISILGRIPGGAKKDAFVFYLQDRAALSDVKKIETLGVRSAFVGSFEVEGSEFTDDDVISKGNDAWDAVFGTVNLGKFLLGYGSIGLCERALGEALDHTRGRVLFGKPVYEMPHIQSTLVQAYARLSAMKLYAYRAADYLQVSTHNDRRYLLFNSVQKARVSTEGVTVMSQLSECMGAKGFERETFFETALRDTTLIPGLEGSTHINFGLTAKLVRNYFFKTDATMPVPPSLSAETTNSSPENPDIFKAEAGKLSDVRFADGFQAFRPLLKNANVKVFESQVRAFRAFVLSLAVFPGLSKDADFVMALGKIFSIVAYGQLVAENAVLNTSPDALVTLMFHQMIEDLSVQILKCLSLPQLPTIAAVLLRRAMATPRTTPKDTVDVARLMLENYSD